jgi:hypothetical protein
LVEEFEVDQAAGDLEERFVDVGAAFVADAEPAVLVQPGEGALDDPALFAEPGAVWLIVGGDAGADASGAELLAVAAGAVGAVAENPVGAAAWPASSAAHRRDRVDERKQLEDVVVVGGGERERERSPASAGDRMVF